MGCYSKSQLAKLRASRTQRQLDAARLANYKSLYLAARAARDYLRDVLLTDNVQLVVQLDAALIDPHKQAAANSVKDSEGEGVDNAKR